MNQSTDGMGAVRQPRLQECLTRLEEIARRMGSGDVELEDALDLHAEGRRLLDRANQILAVARVQVEELTTETPSASRSSGGEERG